VNGAFARPRGLERGLEIAFAPPHSDGASGEARSGELQKPDLIGQVSMLSERAFHRHRAGEIALKLWASDRAIEPFQSVSRTSADSQQDQREDTPNRKIAH
jgi:hypothetical protein